MFIGILFGVRCMVSITVHNESKVKLRNSIETDTAGYNIF